MNILDTAKTLTNLQLHLDIDTSGLGLTLPDLTVAYRES